MHRRLLVGLAALALGPAGSAAQADRPVADPHVRVHAHVLLLDRTEAARVGLRYVQVGRGLMGVQAARLPRGGAGGGVLVGGDLAGLPVAAFIDLARERGVLRSETRTQVVALSGASAMVASGSASVGRWGNTRVRGPELVVAPTVLEDGRVLLDVRVRLRDEISDPWGYGVDGSPVDVATTVVVRPGDEATVGSVRAETQRSDAGFLRWQSGSEALDVLVVLRPEIVDF